MTRDRIVGTGSTALAFDARLVGDKPVVKALIAVTGELADLPPGGGMIAVEIEGDRASTRVAVSATSAYAVFGAVVHRDGDVVTLDRSGLVAATTDPARATGGKAPVHGRFRMDLTASGQLAPTQLLAVRGAMDGYNVRFKDLKVSAIHGSIDATGLPARPVGTAKLRMADLVYGTTQLGALGIAAVNRDDGKLAVSVRSQPKFAPWMIDADALVTLGETVVVELGKHRVRGAGEDWTGAGGRVTVAPGRIELSELRSKSAKGTLAVAGSFDRRSGDLVAHLDSHGALGSFNPLYQGDVDAVLDVTRRRNEWGGKVAISANAVALDPRSLKLDGTLAIELRGRQLGVDAAISTQRAGAAKLALAIETPNDITDVAAWRHLGRSAIRQARVSLDAVDLKLVSELAKQDGISGSVHGALEFSATETGGAIEVKGLKVPQIRGTDGVNATLRVAADGPYGIAPTLTATIKEVGAVEIAARVAVPEHLFDPGAWQALGANALRGATVRVEEIAVDPGMLQRFGIISTLRGRVAMNAAVGEGARTVKLAADVRQLRGEAIAQPLDVHLVSWLDERTASTTVAVTNNGTTLLTAKGNLKLALAELIADPRALSRAPLEFEVAIPKIAASKALATLGRREITAGTLTGKIVVGGSIAHPTVKAALLAVNLQVPPGPGNTPVQHVEKLTVMGEWDGMAGTVRVDGVQRGGGSVNVVAKVDLDKLAESTVSILAKKFDLAPVLAFAPGPAGGAAGRLDANLMATGLDPRRMKLVGFLHLANARIPLAPNLGTLRRAEIDVRISENKLDVKIDGKLGPGSVKIAGSAAIEANAPTGGEATITLRSVSPIGAVEPRVDADITAKVKRENGRWNADVVVVRGKVIVPNDRSGDALDLIGAPDDMVFAAEQHTAATPKKLAPPSDPVIVAKITINPVYV
ncbi:MAG: hypothetical protein H0T79_09090, partial [Deltaproteobacteria bacterium]|nr:hypothetical protein [Deltaproteobacteria bacterium]